MTTQMQQSHISSPQSHPKHGFETDWTGFLTEEPDDEDGRVQFRGEDVEEAAILSGLDVFGSGLGV